MISYRPQKLQNFWCSERLSKVTRYLHDKQFTPNSLVWQHGKNLWQCAWGCLGMWVRWKSACQAMLRIWRKFSKVFPRCHNIIFCAIFINYEQTRWQRPAVGPWKRFAMPCTIYLYITSFGWQPSFRICQPAYSEWEGLWQSMPALFHLTHIPCTGFILACVVRVKNENGLKFTRKK